MKIRQIFSEDIDENNNDVNTYRKQRNNPISIELDSVTNKYYKMQKGIVDDRFTDLFLGPNEVYFNQRNSINCRQSDTSNDELNQKKLFSHIDGLENSKDVMYWPFYSPKNKADITVNCSADIYSRNMESQFILSIDGKKHTRLKIEKNMDDEDLYIWTCRIRRVKRGFHYLELGFDNVEDKKVGLGKLNFLKLTSKSQLRVVRERWRPAATHAKFKSSNAEKIDSWVMTVHNESPTLSSYNPLTTPFGYYGTTLKSDGSASGVNFSLWSYGQKQQEPPLHKLSHLLAIGHPTADFSHFSHEGTGVKIRNYNNLWDSNTSKKYTFAMKMERDPRDFSDGQLNIYYTYFWNEGKAKWQLFGAGKKFNTNKNNPLFLGSFVEVPGPANVERSNHVERRVFYSGYVRDQKNKEWRMVDTMITAKGKDQFSNKQWGMNGDNFFMSAGGLVQYEVEKQPTKIFMNNDEDILGVPYEPIYMDKISQIEAPLPFPSILSHKIREPIGRTQGRLKLQLSIPEKNSQTNTVWVYIGNIDGLTIAKKWDNNYSFKNVKNGIEEIEIPYSKSKKFCRILVKDAELQIWSFETYNIN